MLCLIFLLGNNKLITELLAGLCKLILLCHVVSQCITKYTENYLLYLLLLHNDIWFSVPGALLSLKIFRL
jgi:hypothetical protein